MGNVLNFERTDPFSVECLFKTNEAGDATIVGTLDQGGTNKGWEIYYRGSLGGVISWQMVNTGGGSNAIELRTTDTFNDNKIHHLVCTYDGGSLAAGMKMYFDGVLNSPSVSQDNLSATIISPTNLRIGSRNNQIRV